MKTITLKRLHNISRGQLQITIHARAAHLGSGDPDTQFHQNRKSDRRKISLHKSPFLLHRNLIRAQSSLAMQIRSEHMGLNSYLYRRKVPEVLSPGCPCGYQSQNPKHMIMSCPRWSNGRGKIWRQARDWPYEVMINNTREIKRIKQWILNHGWVE